MCHQIKTIAKNCNGQLSYCENCKVYHLTFSNIYIELTQKEMKSFQNYIAGVNIEYWECKYDTMPIKRKIVVNTLQSNLSYQFFGKVNDPDTAKYYERFFEIIKYPTKSISRGHNLDFDTRITTGEKEIPKIRADVFFRLRQGEFITYADGRDKKVQFKLANIKRELPEESKQYSQADLAVNFERIYEEAKSIFQ